MALLTCRFRSEVLDLDTAMTVVLPDRPSASTGVLHLLHGGSEDHTAWTRRSGIERYAAGLDLAVVMPDGGTGYWVDAVHGARWWTFLSEELPGVVRDLLHLDPPRGRTFAAGLSRGGYGALKLGLRQPDRFAAVAGLSAKIDIANEDWSEPRRRDWFGDAGRARREGNDLLALLEEVDAATCPELLLSCGTEDALLDESRRFAAAAEARGLPVWATEGPGGHEWDVWDRDIRGVLTRFADLRASTA